MTLRLESEHEPSSPLPGQPRLPSRPPSHQSAADVAGHAKGAAPAVASAPGRLPRLSAPPLPPVRPKPSPVRPKPQPVPKFPTILVTPPRAEASLPGVPPASPTGPRLGTEATSRCENGQEPSSALPGQPRLPSRPPSHQSAADVAGHAKGAAPAIVSASGRLPGHAAQPTVPKALPALPTALPRLSAPPLPPVRPKPSPVRPKPQPVPKFPTILVTPPRAEASLPGVPPASPTGPRLGIEAPKLPLVPKALPELPSVLPALPALPTDPPAKTPPAHRSAADIAGHAKSPAPVIVSAPGRLPGHAAQPTVPKALPALPTALPTALPAGLLAVRWPTSD